MSSPSLDLYGHLMPGAEAEAAALLDAFLDGGVTDLDSTGQRIILPGHGSDPK